MTEEIVSGAQPEAARSNEFTQEEFARVAGECFTIRRISDLQLRCAVGERVLKAFYGGDFDVWNRRNDGDTALDRLAAELEKLEPGGTWSATWLYTAVRLHEQEKLFSGFTTWPGLTVTHFVVVQGLPFEVQKALLDEAEAGDWSTRTLQEKTQALRAGPASPKRAEAGQAASLLRRLHRVLEDGEKVVGGLREAGLPEDELSALAAALTNAHQRVEAAEQKLSVRKTSRRAQA